MLYMPSALDIAVDAAQILSALATTAAVITSVWLAHRSGQQRPKLTVAICMDDDGSNLKTGAIELKIVNSGNTPFQVTRAALSFRLTSGSVLNYDLGPYDGNGEYVLPRKIDYSDQIIFKVYPSAILHCWVNVSRSWWLLRRPTFRVWTTLGTYYVKPARRLLWHINRHCIEPEMPSLKRWLAERESGDNRSESARAHSK